MAKAEVRIAIISYPELKILLTSFNSPVEFSVVLLLESYLL